MIDKDLIIKLQQAQLNAQTKMIGLQNSQLIYKDELLDDKNKLIAEMRIMIEMLENHVKTLENNQKKDSSNSSKPPSTDIAKPNRTQSLRTKSGKQPGGQPGHTGETLYFSETPDMVVSHEINNCQCCGKYLSDKTIVNHERRQVYDIPPIQMLVTEHRSQIKYCPGCNAINKAQFPKAVSQSVQYGDNVRQLAVYFTQYQLLPIGRTAEIFEDLFGHHPSSSFLVNNNHRCAENLQLFMTGLKGLLRAEPVAHVDETGYYFEGKRNWLHTISTEKFSYYAVHAKRGTEAMVDMDVLKLFKGTLVHDFWKSYLDFFCAHALCNVHHVRDLTFCHEVENSIWAGQVKELLLDLNAKVQLAKEADSNARSLNKEELHYWYKKYDALVNEGFRMHPIPEKQKGKRGVIKKSKTQNLIQRFVDYKEEILAFAKNFMIPFSNNIAEQAIRMMKVKQKISGCFRSEQGAKDFADTRSYIATAKKQGVPIMQALARAVQGTPLTVMG